MKAASVPVDLEVIFRAQYPRIARVIARVISDPARAEELAVEVFLKLWRSPEVQNQKPEAWLYRVAVRSGIDELRRQARRTRYESFLKLIPAAPTPEEIHSTNEEQQRVRTVLATIDVRQAELLMLRSHGLSYEELAAALEIKLSSVGTLLSRAQQAFRKNFVRRFGDEHGTD
ncbi:MAG: sigma-70 family RNA polymerase sigma factor [Candidatus Acidiferrales bacterium]